MATQPAPMADDGGTTFELGSDDLPRDFEAEARQHGWTPKEEFKGDPNRWVDAETFVNRADEVMPLLKKKTQHQQREIDDLKRQIKRLTKAEQAAYENAMADLKAKMEEAVERGDLTAYRAADKKLGEMREQVTEAPQQHGEDPQEQYEAFREANAWYDRGNLASASEVEVEARLFADRLADKYARQGLTAEIPPSEFFARVARETEEKFPLLKAKATRQKPPSAVEGVTNGGAPRGNKARTGANLPPEAKEHAERYMRMGIYKGCKTNQEAWDRFAKDYTGWN